MSHHELNHSVKNAIEATEFLRGRWGRLPGIAIFAGTGLGEMIASIQIQDSVDYESIPHFPTSTVQSHAGRMVIGLLQNLPVILMQGRFHLYEGYSASAVTFPIRVLQGLDVHTLVLTNASGGLNPTFKAGEIMLIEDHINLTGVNPLVGPNEESWGPRFPDMTAAYDKELRNAALTVSHSLGIGLQRGVYAGLKGPSLETPAEMRFLRTIGADAVGFSTVVETIAAVHGGMRVLGLSTITNMCLPDALTPSSVDEIIAVAQAAAPRLAALIIGVLNSVHTQTSGDAP